MSAGTRREREAATHRLEILTAAKRVFARKGFAATTIDEIAQEADFSKGAMYGYFEGKEDLFLSLIEEKMDELEAILVELVERADDPETKIRDLVETHLGFFEADKDFFQILASEHPRFEAETESRLIERMRQRHVRWSGLVEQVMKDGVSTGLLRSMDPQLLVAALVGLVHSFTCHWILTGAEGSLTDMAPVIERLYLEGAKR